MPLFHLHSSTLCFYSHHITHTLHYNFLPSANRVIVTLRLCKLKWRRKKEATDIGSGFSRIRRNKWKKKYYYLSKGHGTYKIHKQNIQNKPRRFLLFPSSSHTLNSSNRHLVRGMGKHFIQFRYFTFKQTFISILKCLYIFTACLKISFLFHMNFCYKSLSRISFCHTIFSGVREFFPFSQLKAFLFFLILQWNVEIVYK